MKLSSFKLGLALVFMLGAMVGELAAQCTTWLHPAPPATYNDMNNVFGGAPCDAGLGCPFNEIQTFEVYPGEAYIVSNFIAGGTYSFSICNGPGVGSWVPEFTILSPSGAVAAYGPGDGDHCTITWTATENGSYKFIINEAGYCPGGPHDGIGNGRPALRCISGADCSQANCKAGHLTSHDPISVCGPGATFQVGATATLPPNGGGYGWYFSDAQGGTGGVAGGFLLSGFAPSGGSFNADLNGFLSSNSLPALEGTWTVRGAAYKLVDNPFGSLCSVTQDSLVLHFSPNPAPVAAIADNGNSSATASATGGLAPYSFLWSNGQTTPTATGLGTGSYTVVVTDANGCTGSATVEVVSGVGGIPGLASLGLSPNPTTGFFTLKLALVASQNVEIQLLDINGRQLLAMNDFTAGRDFNLDLSGHPAGVYLLKIKVGNGVLAQRVLLTQ